MPRAPLGSLTFQLTESCRITLTSIDFGEGVGSKTVSLPLTVTVTQPPREPEVVALDLDLANGHQNAHTIDKKWLVGDRVVVEGVILSGGPGNAGVQIMLEYDPLQLEFVLARNKGIMAQAAMLPPTVGDGTVRFSGVILGGSITENGSFVDVEFSILEGFSGSTSLRIAEASFDYPVQVDSTLGTVHITGSLPTSTLDELPNSFDFGIIRCGRDSVQTLVVRNRGDGVLSLGLAMTDAAFTASIDTADVAPADSLLVEIAFVPPDTLAYVESLMILSNDPEKPGAVISLTGIGYLIPGLVLLDLDPQEGNQGVTIDGKAPGEMVTIQFFGDGFPEIEGFGLNVEFDDNTMSCLEDSFAVGGFIPDASGLIAVKSGSVELGAASLAGNSGAGDGFLASLQFRMTDTFQDTTFVIAVTLGYSLVGEGLDEKPIYSRVTITKEDPGLLGDFDDDGKVGFRDFLLFSREFGGNNPEFDLDGDGMVGFGDFLAFTEVFGNTAAENPG